MANWSSFSEIMQAERSPKFYRMYRVERQERASGERGRVLLTIIDTSFPVMRELIRFCYSGDVDFSDEVTYEEMLTVAHKYEIGLLRAICEGNLGRTLNIGNLASRLKLAKKFNAEELYAKALKYFKDHFDEAIDFVLDELM